MENSYNFSDIAKETLTFLAFFDNDLIKKIPTRIITELSEKAADSNLNFYIDQNKSFRNQKISEKSKDLISLLYYNYIASDEEKKEIINLWDLNQKE